MKRSGQVAVVALLAAAVVIVAAVRGREREPAARRAEAAANAPVARSPRLVDLGAGKGIAGVAVMLGGAYFVWTAM